MEDDRADIFISYAHLDDSPIYEEEGWVTRFKKYLEPRLKMILANKNLKIWKDEALRGNDFFAEEIHKQLSKNTVLVCINSPAYLKSPWCGKEVDFFKSRDGDPDGYKIGTKSKIFKVMKMKVDRSKESELMQQQLGYQFYNENGIEHDPSYGGEIRLAYDAKLTDLAKDISEILETIMDEKSQHDEKKKVFLAESPDCLKERDDVRRELEALGFSVIPKKSIYTSSYKNYTQSIQQALEASDFIIQLLGGDFGNRFEDNDGSVVSAQHEFILSDKLKKKTFVWIKEIEGRSKDMEDFIDDFYQKVDNTPIGEGDLISIYNGLPIQKLNHEIGLYVKSTQKSEVQPPDGDSSIEKSSEIKKVFLVFAESDKQSKQFLPLYKYLASKGIEVRLPTFSDDEAKIKESFQVQVANCDGIILYYGDGDDLWLSKQQQLIENLLENRQPSLAIYLDKPETLEKEILSSAVYKVIDGMQSEDYQELGPLNEFLTELIGS